MRRFSHVLGFGLLVAATTCAPSGPYVWADDYIATVKKEPHQGYLIAVGDLVAVRVFGHDDLSVRERVREDGQISLPILKDVDAAGLAPQALGE